MINNIKIPKAKEIGHSKVITLKEDNSAFEMISIFEKFNISSAPVINERCEVVGFVAEGDLFKVLEESLFFDEQRIPNVGEIMETKVMFAKPDWNIFELDDFFTFNNLRCAPIVDSENILISFVIKKQLFKSLVKLTKDRFVHIKNLNEPIALSMYQKVGSILEGRVDNKS